MEIGIEKLESFQEEERENDYSKIRKIPNMNNLPTRILSSQYFYRIRSNVIVSNGFKQDISL